MFKHHWHALFDNMSFTWSLTFYIMLPFFPFSASSSASPGMSTLTTSIWSPDNLFYCFDLALRMNYPCMLQKCHDSVWVTMQFTVCSLLSCYFLSSPSLPLSLMPAFKNTKTYTCSVFVLRRVGCFLFCIECSRILSPPLHVVINTSVMTGCCKWVTV